MVVRLAAAAAALILTLAACAPDTVTVGEDYDPLTNPSLDAFGVPPGGQLDLVMYQYTTDAPNGWMAEGTPQHRCDLYGGTLVWREVPNTTWLLICEDVHF